MLCHYRFRLSIRRSILARVILPVLFAASLAADDIPPTFQPLFDGQTLDGWRPGDTPYWSVEDGSITGLITTEHPCDTNQYLVWTGGELADFELKLKSRLTGDGAINNGFQFRSRVLPDHDVCGYQVDNNLGTPWLVRLYDEYGRHDLALRGQHTVFSAEGDRRTTALDDAAGPAWFRLEEWHEYHLRCVGPKITLHVDGRLAAQVDDLDERRQELQGFLALQLHSGPPTKVQFKDIALKILKPASMVFKAEQREGATARAALRREAAAWWNLDAGGHGDRPPLRLVPAFYEFELNVKSRGAGARPNEKVALLHGAYFDAGSELHVGDEQATIYLRARDPAGQWNGGLFAKRGGHDRVHCNLFSVDLPDTAGPDIGFEIRTDQGFHMVSFPVSRVEADAWHDLVGRYDGTQLSLYCDGSLMARAACQGKLVTNREPLLIGAETDVGQVVRKFNGEFSVAAFWSRALTDNEIVALSRGE
ncbi:MAG: DUF1080 domain-containing protein [Planctomycetales bacterium]|nr:DUF1080 domain-containing protein [Planctomycetales bacterium]